MRPEASESCTAIRVDLIATMAAFVLGLLIASAESSFDAHNSKLSEASSRIVSLDRVLAHYGPEANAESKKPCSRPP